MRNTLQAKNSNTRSSTISSWDEAIAAVEVELSKMQAYIARLKAAKWVFVRNKTNGLTWPGSVQEMLNKFDAGLAEQKKSPRQKARAAA